MENFDITVFYACHNPQADTHPDFPVQTLPSGKIQLLPLQEPDLYRPRKSYLDTIEKAQGRFYILLDEGDMFDIHFLERMMFSAKDADIAFVMPAMTSLHIERKPEYFSLNQIEDIRITPEKRPPVFPTGLHGLLIRTEYLQRALSYRQSVIEEEKQVLLALLNAHPCFLYNGSCSLKYSFPKECDYQYDLRCFTKEWYYDSLEQFLLPLLDDTEQKYGSVPLLLQHLALHMLHIRVFANLNNRNKHVIPPEDVPAYIALFTQVLRYIDTGTILSKDCNPTASSDNINLFDLRMKKNDFSYYPDLSCEKDTVLLTCDGQKFGDLNLLAARINLIDYKNGCLEIDGGINNYFAPESGTVFAMFDGKKYPLSYNQRYSLSKCFGVTFSRLKTFHVSVPVSASDQERLLQFVFCTGNREYVMNYAFPSHTSRFAKDFTYGYWRFGPYFSYWAKDGIHVIKSSRMLILYKELRLWKQIWSKKGGVYRNQLPLKILNFLLRPWFSRQKIWLFFDKIYKGGDSSEYIYRYASQKKDGIRKYYLLDKNSADYARMKKEGFRPLIRGSLKHRLVFLNADMVIASNSTVFAFNDYTFNRSLVIRGDVHFDVACVQHGMSVQKIALAQQRLRDNTKLYFCASKYEIENLSKPIYDYIGYDALKLTGVPRYDGLKDRAEKIILLSPTWRMQSALPVTMNEGVARDYNPNFRETDYYRVYNSLINDPRLLDAAKAHGYRIKYVLHPIVSPQCDDFTKNDFVEIIPSIGDMSYEKLFCESALMVTDYSGVQFDFAYMRKPVVYLHHNDIPQHYEEGTFHYDTMAFGEICHTNEELIDVLCRYMENNCVMPEVYRKRADDFFAFSDHNNCERIYNIMLEHENKREK